MRRDLTPNSLRIGIPGLTFAMFRRDSGDLPKRGGDAAAMALSVVALVAQQRYGARQFPGEPIKSGCWLTR
jgi:hypothetical protein